MRYSNSIAKHIDLQIWMTYNPSTQVGYKLASAVRQVKDFVKSRNSLCALISKVLDVTDLQRKVSSQVTVS